MQFHPRARNRMLTDAPSPRISYSVVEIMFEDKHRKKQTPQDLSANPYVQQRDGRGRFISSINKLIMVDETGDLGLGDKTSKNFVLAATITKHPNEFRAIADKYPPDTRRIFKTNELKFSNSSDLIRNQILMDVVGLKPDIYAVIIEKRNIPNGLKNRGAHIYRIVAELLMDDIMKNTSGNLTVIYDPHTALQGNVGCRATKTAAKKYGRNVKLCTQKVSSDRDRALQTHDFVVGAIGHKVNRDDDELYSIIERLTKTHRIE